ncbi:cytochrome c oxidase subunit II [Notoacmeibacter marinus]|uniref:Cytochrome c oxidase subunit 2 n=1 Tax=Notoacmeibacter marinus TaxID=1876515 RepID=A0A231UUF3_9HYPH|nr:cytochrome c oxidase subunit II [Notoacmeibacter marinus]OXS99539.1 cytochrome c oxidase subunit II [Notoacmeibacter marinus]
MKRISASLLTILLGGGAAHAAKPEPWQFTLQPAATPIMEQIIWFETYTFWFIIPIVLFVLALLLYVAFRFRESANKTPSRTSHNTVIEVIWTAAPILILLLLAIPSFNLLTAQYTPDEEPELTVKATGYQWYWGYEYQPAEGAEEGVEAVSYDSIMLKEGDRESAGKTDMNEYPRLLAVDNEMVVPVDTTVRLLVTGADVIHAFAMPAFGLKHDGVPGRINEAWFRAEKEGIYYGQCSEICGKDHAYMPIAVRVVSKDQYNTFIQSAGSDLRNAFGDLVASIEADKNKKLADATAGATTTMTE